MNKGENAPALKGKYESDEEGFVSFGDVARGELGQQCQYASRYIDPDFSDEYAYLGEGLRFAGFNKGKDYHAYRIHKDDIEEFVRRYNAHQEERMRS